MATRRRGWLMRRLLLLADAFGLGLAVTLPVAVYGSRGPGDGLSAAEELSFILVLIPFWAVAARLFGLYDFDEERADHSTADELIRVFLLLTASTFLLSRAGLAFGLQPDDAKLTAFWAVGVVAIAGARIAARLIGRRTSAYTQKVVIVGAGDVGQRVARKLLMHPEYGFELVGFVDGSPRARSGRLADVPVLGPVEDLLPVVAERGVDRVVLAFSRDPQERLIASVRRLRDAGVQVDIVPRLYEVIGPRHDVHAVEGLPLVGLAPVRLARSSRLFKRALDVVVAGVALAVLSPVLLVIALAVRIDSGGPVIFRQRRLGKDMREFTVLKFRTMRAEADDTPHRAYLKELVEAKDPSVGTGVFKLAREDVVTRVGRLLRKTSLDELPQLVNVLRGDMSLVGPRPCLAYEVQHFRPHHFDRFHVPAGLTGLWQVSARANATFLEALDLDVLYAHSASFGLDLKILARTPVQLLRPRVTA